MTSFKCTSVYVCPLLKFSQWFPTSLRTQTKAITTAPKSRSEVLPFSSASFLRISSLCLQPLWLQFQHLKHPRFFLPQVLCTCWCLYLNLEYFDWSHWLGYYQAIRYFHRKIFIKYPGEVSLAIKPSFPPNHSSSLHILVSF